MKKQIITRQRAKQIILSNEPALTSDIVDRYTDSELMEWMKLFKLNVKIGLRNDL